MYYIQGKYPKLAKEIRKQVPGIDTHQVEFLLHQYLERKEKEPIETIIQAYLLKQTQSNLIEQNYIIDNSTYIGINNTNFTIYRLDSFQGDYGVFEKYIIDFSDIDQKTFLETLYETDSEEKTFQKLELQPEIIEIGTKEASLIIEDIQNKNAYLCTMVELFLYPEDTLMRIYEDSVAKYSTVKAYVPDTVFSLAGYYLSTYEKDALPKLQSSCGNQLSSLQEKTKFLLEYTNGVKEIENSFSNAFEEDYMEEFV